MKFVIAMMQHETNTFSSLPTPYKSFSGATQYDHPPIGADAIAAYGGTDFPFAAFLDIASSAGAEVVTPIAAFAEPSGTVDDDAFLEICDRICAAVKDGCDAVMLDLHGAMVAQSFDDAEGELLRRIRECAPQIPIAVALDFHSHITETMVANATVITGYRTYPHTDMYETGRRAGETLMAALRGDIEPRMIWDSLPLISHLLRQTPNAQPMKDIMVRAVTAEAEGQVLNASIFGGFPFADITHVSLAAVIVVDGKNKEAASLITEMLQMAWERRADFIFHPEPLTETIAYAKTLHEGPTVIADHGDNSGAGGPADDMTVIAEMLRQGLSDIAAGPIWDPEAVAAMHEAGLGETVTLEIGGKTDTPSLGLKGQPLRLTGKVTGLSDGRFTIQGPMMTGFGVNLGRTALLDTGSLELVVSEDRCEAYDTGYLSHVGVDPTAKRYVVVKSRQHFCAGFEDLAKNIVLAAGLGVCTSEHERFKFRRLSRPIYPFDQEAEWLPRH